MIFSQKNTMMEIPLPMPRIINAGKKYLKSLIIRYKSQKAYSDVYT